MTPKRILMAVLLILVCVAQGVDSRVGWIWYPENAQSDALNQYRYFRKIFKLNALPSESEIIVSADDGYQLWVNGTRIFPENKKNYGWKYPDIYKLKNVLKLGENVFAFKVFNGISHAGLIFKSTLKTNGNLIKVYSDSTCKVSKNVDKDWYFINYDDSGWKESQRLGNCNIAPWGNRGFPVELFLYSDETMFRNHVKETLDDKISISKLNLESAPSPNVKIIYDQGRPFILLNGRKIPPFIYIPKDPMNGFWSRQIKLAGENHIPIFHYPIQLRFMDPEINYKVIDHDFRRLLNLNPNAYLIVSFGVVPTQSWIKNNPDELIGYATENNSGDKDDLEREKTASFASQKWRKYSVERMLNIISFIKRQPWNKRVIGYHIRYGINSEWHYYGMRKDFPDTGKCMNVAFCTWLKRKYGNLKKLRQAWNMSNANFCTNIPTLSERLPINYQLRTPLNNQKMLDYYEFMHEVAANTIEYFAEAIKKYAGRQLLCGVYYGYFFGMNFPPEGYHLGFERIVHSPNIDFLCSPYDYCQQSRNLGGDGLFRTLSESIRAAGKLFIMEDDTFTHLSGIHHWAKNDTESVALLKRQLFHAAIRGFGLQYIEFHDDGFGKNERGWYESKAISSAIKDGIELYNDLPPNGLITETQVCLVISPDNIPIICYKPKKGSFQQNYLSEVAHALGRTGVPFDVISLSDLGSCNLPNYKFYLLPNAFSLTDIERTKIKKIARKSGTNLMFFYAAGAITHNGITPASMKELIGINVQTGTKLNRIIITEPNSSRAILKECYASIDSLFPYFYVKDHKVSVEGVYSNGQAALVSRRKDNGGNIYYCAIPGISTTFLRKCFKQNGINPIIEDGSIVYCNGNLLSLHVKKGGKKILHFPHNITSLRNYFTDKTYYLSSGVCEIEVSDNSTNLFVLLK